MTPLHRQHAPASPVARFLGPGAANSGPFGLLGVEPSRCDDAAVREALRARLLVVDEHPHAATPEADEVRLALHAAAAQLLNPQFRLRLVQQYAPRLAANPALAAAAGRRRSFQEETLLVIGVCGGWNAEARRRLAIMARSRGLDARALSSAVLGVSARRTEAPPEGPATNGKAEPAPRAFEPLLPDELDPGYRFVQRIIWAFGIVIVAIVALGGLAAILSAPKKPPPAVAATPAASPAPSHRHPAELFPTAPTAAAPAAAPRQADAARLIRDVQTATAGIAVDPIAAADNFRSALGALAEAWCTLAADQLVAAQDAVVEFVYRASSNIEFGKASIDAVAAHAQWLGGVAPEPVAPRVWPAAWSAGILSRLAREKDLPAGVMLRIDAELRQVLPAGVIGERGSFDSGLAAALSLIAEALAPRRALSDEALADLVQAWSRWADAALRDERAGARRVLGAVETILQSGPEPTESRPAFQTVSELVGRLDLRTNIEARAWVLRWFSAPAVSAPDLFTVTSRLASNPTLSAGVDVTMVVPANASERQREELRERFARLWGLVADGHGREIIKEWSRQLRELASLPPTEDAGERMARIVTLSRLSEAAGWVWSGDAPRAWETLGAAEEPGRQAAARKAVFRAPGFSDALTGHAEDGQWGARVLGAQGAADRLRIINERTFGLRFGPRDAAVLVGEAVRGNERVRRAAQELIARNGQDVAVVNALLIAAPTLPRSAETTAMVESVGAEPLPSTDDPSWRIALRRHLAERLLALLANDGEFRAVDELASALAKSYLLRAGIEARSADAPGEPVAAAEQFRLRWERLAQACLPTGREPSSLKEIQRRRLARRESASGLVQRFAVEQLCAFELMAFVLIAEEPARADDCLLIVEETSRDRLAARGILDQIEAVERGIGRLWLVRLGEPLTPPVIGGPG